MGKGFIHPTAVIGGPPEHRRYIWRWYAGKFVQSYQHFFEPKVSPKAIVHAFCTIDAGIGRPTSIGAGSFLMARCHIGHDVVIGNNCELGAGVVVCGEVTIGDNVQIGGNTWIRPQIKIGDGARIGGGSVVVKDIPAGEVWAGNPAKPLRKGREAAARGQAWEELKRINAEMTRDEILASRKVDHDDHAHLQWPRAAHGEQVDWTGSVQ